MAIQDTSVRYFDSTMTGAPTLNGTAGTLIGVLDACLVDGVGSVAITSIVVSANVATVTCQAAHNLALIGSTGPVVRISGVDSPAALNGDWRVATIPSGSVFTFQTEGIAGGGASGASMAVKRAPAGWERPFSGANKAVYARTAFDSTAMVLRVDDSPAQYPTLIMYESMTDADTGIGPSTLGYAAKSATANTTARPWVLIADHRMLFLFADTQGNSTWASGFLFGDIDSYGPDAYSCIMFAHATQSINFHPLYSNVSGLKHISRSYTQTGNSVACIPMFCGPDAANLGLAGTARLDPLGNALHVRPIEILEGTSLLAVASTRGRLPGCWNTLTKMSGLAQGDIYSDFLGLPGRDLRVQKVATVNYGGMLDITGPWRE